MNGHRRPAHANLLRAVAIDAAYVAAFIEQRTTGPVVLVGHSYGGFVISNAGAKGGDVRALVYIDAFAPDEGETTFQILGGSGSALDVPDPTTVLDLVSYPGAPEGDLDAYLKPDTVHTAFAQDLPEADRWLIVASQRPLTLAANTTPSGVEVTAQLDGRGHRRPGHPARHATPHGTTRGRHGHRGGRLARLDGLTAPGDDRRDPRRGRRY